jgi:hypothetical protein|tara:strand:+ start:1943 stop:2236 length:294 start_codon:yes stop_codon:yes gene_type:complete
MNQAEKISYILETILNCDEYIVPSDSKSFFDIIWIKETKKCSESEFNSALSEYEAKQYQRDRALAFDPIPEQLDQIYHDIDGWKAKIKAVKDKYPKP